MTLRSAVLVLMVVLGAFADASGACAAETNLDSSFRDFASTCQPKDDIERFLVSLRARYGYDDKKPPNPHLARPVVIPDGIRSAVGKASATYRGGYTEITVALVGRYNGLKTRSFTFLAGDNNGVYDLWVSFDESISDVERVFGKEVRIANQALKKEGPEVDLSAAIRLEGGRPSIRCNLST